MHETPRTVGSEFIPLFRLKAQVELIGPEGDAAIARSIERRHVPDHELVSFEERFADYRNVAYSRAVNSGTPALDIALLAAEIGVG